MHSKKNDDLFNSLTKKLNSLQYITTILSLCVIALLLLLLLLSKTNSISSNGPLLPSEKNTYAFATLYKYSISDIEYEKIGKISIIPDNSASNSGLNPVFLKGMINNLKPGTSHGMLLVENANFLLEMEEFSNEIFHFNPLGSLNHKCKTDSNIDGHMGDFGDVIANEEGNAIIDKYLNDFKINLIFGRAIVILNNESDCDNENFYLNKKDIMGFGILGIYSEDQEGIQLKRQFIDKKNKILENNALKEKKDKEKIFEDKKNEIFANFKENSNLNNDNTDNKINKNLFNNDYLNKESMKELKEETKEKLENFEIKQDKKNENFEEFKDLENPIPFILNNEKINVDEKNQLIKNDKSIEQKNNGILENLLSKPYSEPIITESPKDFDIKSLFQTDFPSPNSLFQLNQIEKNSNDISKNISTNNTNAFIMKNELKDKSEFNNSIEEKHENYINSIFSAVNKILDPKTKEKKQEILINNYDNNTKIENLNLVDLKKNNPEIKKFKTKYEKTVNKDLHNKLKQLEKRKKI